MLSINPFFTHASVFDIGDVGIIEDDVDCLDWIRHWLEKEDISHWVYYDKGLLGPELADFCAECQPKIVITSPDWGKSGEEGLAFIQALEIDCEVILLVEPGDFQTISRAADPEVKIRVFAKYDPTLFSFMEKVLNPSMPEWVS